MSAPSPTVTVQVAVFPLPVLAVIFAVPFESAVTTPFSETSAISGFELCHVKLSVLFSGEIAAESSKSSPPATMASFVCDILTEDAGITISISITVLTLSRDVTASAIITTLPGFKPYSLPLGA